MRTTVRHLSITAVSLCAAGLLASCAASSQDSDQAIPAEFSSQNETVAEFAMLSDTLTQNKPKSGVLDMVCGHLTPIDKQMCVINDGALPLTP